MAKNLISRIALGGLGMLTHPQDPREFIQVFNPLASSHYTRGLVTGVHRETADSATITFNAGEGWVAHKAGQWARIGVAVNGRRLWRPYSLSAGEDHNPSVTVTARGVVSNALVHHTEPGDVLYLEKPAGQFLLDASPTALLFLTAGSGITPVMSMLRTLMPRRPDHDVVLIHSARDRASAIFYEEILELADQFPGLKPTFHFTEHAGRLSVACATDLTRLCPDAGERTTYVCGPDEFVRDVETAAQQLVGGVVVERFDAGPLLEDTGGPGTVTLHTAPGQEPAEVNVAAGQSILTACEDAGQQLPHGCRVGVCRSCSIMMTDGAVQNMRTGEVTREPGMIQSCISRPAPQATIEQP